MKRPAKQCNKANISICTVENGLWALAPFSQLFCGVIEEETVESSSSLASESKSSSHLRQRASHAISESVFACVPVRWKTPGPGHRLLLMVTSGGRNHLGRLSFEYNLIGKHVILNSKSRNQKKSIVRPQCNRFYSGRFQSTISFSSWEAIFTPL